MCEYRERHLPSSSIMVMVAELLAPITTNAEEGRIESVSVSGDSGMLSFTRGMVRHAVSPVTASGPSDRLPTLGPR